MKKVIRDFKSVGVVRNLLVDEELKNIDFTKAEYLIEEKETAIMIVFSQESEDDDSEYVIIIDHNLRQLNSIIHMQKGIDLQLTEEI